MTTTTATLFGASLDSWIDFDLCLGLTEDLLPVVADPNARISPASTMKSLGKTPSTYNSSGLAVGIPNWTSHLTTGAEITRWSKNRNLGICIQTRVVRAIDCDITDNAFASELHAEIDRFLRIALPTRYRLGSPKFLLALTLPGDYSKRVIKTPHGIIEFLATGQQFVADSTHPSGSRYQWVGGLPNDIPVVTDAKFEALWAHLEAKFAVEAGTASKASTKAQKLALAAANDPVAAALLANGAVTGAERDGRVHITCPWAEEHTSDTGPSSTTYWPANTGGYARGHFKCLHAHCEQRTDQEFLEALGLAEDPASYFEAIEEELPVADGAEGDVGLLFSDVVLRKEDVTKMAEAEFLIQNMIVRGHVGAYVAPGNGGKTTLFVYLCEALSAMGMKVLYINVDGSPGDLKRHHAHAEKHGYQVVAPDAKDGKSTADVLRKLHTIAAGKFRCDDYVFILDTLKKFVDVIDKRQAKNLYKLMRTLTVKGATICLLGHCNKYKDDDGKAIFEGTADLRNDLDELIYLDSFFNESKNCLEITTRPDKVRAEFKPVSYVIDLANDRQVRESDVVFNIFSAEERGLLDLIKDAIREGSHSQKDIIDWVKGKTTSGERKIRERLLRHVKGTNPELVVRQTGRGKDLQYSLSDPAAGFDVLSVEGEAAPT